MRGIKAKLLMMSLSIVSVFGLVTSWLYMRSVEGQKSSLMKVFSSSAAAVADSVMAQFYERYGDVQAFGRNTAFSGKDSALMVEVLNNYAVDYGIYDLMLFVDMKGNYVASNSKSPSGAAINTTGIARKNFKDEPWFKNVIEGTTTNDPNGLKGTYMENPHIDLLVKGAYGTDGYGTIFSALVKNPRGEPIGVMSNHANLAWIEYDMLAQYKKLSTMGYAQSDIFLVNKDGLVISSIDPTSVTKPGEMTREFGAMLLKYNPLTSGDEGVKRALTGQSGDALLYDPLENRAHVYGYSPFVGKKWVPSVGWAVVVKSETDIVFAGVDAARLMFFEIGGLTFLLCIAASWIFSTVLSKRLSKIASGVTDAQQNVGMASSELAGSSQIVSSGATQAAASLEETVASLEELTSMVRLNSDNAAQASAIAAGSTKTAQDGENEVRSLIASMTEISASSQKIEDIINVIDDIAFQTNLLALNAAVEAARAGEQGRGFAVVAEAVRTLAQRSATAAKEISGLIRDNVSKISSGTKQADRSGIVLKEILTSVKKVADISNEIASASQEQSTGLSQISKAMNELDQATQRNAATSEEVAASSEAMSEQAIALSAVVNNLNHIIYGQNNSNVKREDSEQLQRPKPSAPSGGKMQMKTTVSHKSKFPIAKSATAQKKSTAETVIPFGDDEPTPGLGTTKGF
jgi:Methyl-accepting chemotaxis protein (MCP) signalling domain